MIQAKIVVHSLSGIPKYGTEYTLIETDATRIGDSESLEVLLTLQESKSIKTRNRSAIQFQSKDDVESLSYSISDILCWLNGYMAGADRSLPIDIETLRSFNIRLKELWRNFDKGGK